MFGMTEKSNGILTTLATVEEMNPEGAMEVQTSRALGMGWAWYVNDLSKCLPDAETLADMTPAENVSVGISPEVPLSDIGLEPEVAPHREVLDPYVVDVPSLIPLQALPTIILWEVTLRLCYPVLRMSIWSSQPSTFRCRRT